MPDLITDNIVCNLYQSKFLSASEIALRLGLSLDSIYRILIRQGVKRRTAAHQNNIRFEKSKLSYSFIENPSLEQQLLTIAALMLYSGEGAKTGSTVDFANSSQELHQVFLLFLREVCQIEENRLKFYLYCFSNQDANQLINFWSQTLHISAEQFSKPYIKNSKAVPKREISHGVLHIRYSDKRLLQKLLKMCDDTMEKLIQQNYVGR